MEVNLCPAHEKMLKKYCQRDNERRFMAALDNLESTTVKIVNTGIVSAGKSSLYNVLTDNMEKERFPTGAARTTVNADSFAYHGIEYIDTPGIDVKDADDEIAFQTVMGADIILMVHNIRTGPLTRSEEEWLQRIVAAIPNDAARRERLVFICTWKDGREKETGYDDIVQEVRGMVYNIVGTEIPFFSVSAKKYLNGVTKGKKRLCESSGIVELRSYLLDKAVQYQSKKAEYAREAFTQAANEVKEELWAKKRAKMADVERMKERAKSRFKSTRNSWSGVFSYFKRRRENLDELNRELRSI
jgi:tRNA U34 5-carboxymethylaminomethyl modifying GTPase MnmE/TrmE